MKNLDQIRARNAYAFAISDNAKGGQDGGEVIKKIPPMILNNGFLAAAAYGFDRDGKGDLRNEGHKLVFDAIAAHLADADIGIVPRDCTALDKLVRHLTRDESNSGELKLVTAEAMAWLNFARRFVNRNSNGKESGR